MTGTPEQPTVSRAAPWALLCKGALLLAAVAASVLAVAWLIPDGNDYAEATLLKHHRLETTAGKRIILVGGSNLAFGVDSTVIERVTGCPVVNMGMNGYLGLQYMLAETQPHLHESDVVVISLEYDNYFKSPAGTAVDQLMIVKANPSALSYLDWRQRTALVPAVPYVAQQKVLRIMGESADAVWMAAMGRPPAEKQGVDIENIESVKGFTDRGDLTSHLGVTWPWEREDGVDATNTPADPHVVPMLASFTAQMRERGIEVIISPTSVMNSYYAKHQRSLEAIFADMTRASLHVPSGPSAYAFDDRLFFDTVYHLNREGRQLRSERMASDIVAELSDKALCTTPHLISKN